MPYQMVVRVLTNKPKLEKHFYQAWTEHRLWRWIRQGFPLITWPVGHARRVPIQHYDRPDICGPETKKVRTHLYTLRSLNLLCQLRGQMFHRKRRRVQVCPLTWFFSFSFFVKKIMDVSGGQINDTSLVSLKGIYSWQGALQGPSTFMHHALLPQNCRDPRTLSGVER